MFCKQCGNQIDEDALFCPKCGANQKSQSVSQQAFQNTQSPTQQPNVVVPNVIVNVDNHSTNTAVASAKSTINNRGRYRSYGAISSKSKVMALILAIFLGYFGVHKFYVGKMGMGILYLCTCGLFGIGWIYDIVQICRGKFTDKYGLPLIK